jgi:hypothetical protein
MRPGSGFGVEKRAKMFYGYEDSDYSDHHNPAGAMKRVRFVCHRIRKNVFAPAAMAA